MDIYAYLKKDHRLVKGLMEELLGTKDAKKRDTLFHKIKDELEIHSETEEKTFYAALKKKGGKQVQEKEEHAEEEHDEIRHFLAEVEKYEANSAPWLVAFGELKHVVEHHVEEEEGEIFEKAKKLLSDTQAKQLAEDMDAMKQRKKGGKPKSDEKDKGVFGKLFAA
jgi:hemerythrin superfamily protein